MPFFFAEDNKMNEITNALKVANTAIKTVRIIDIFKKVVIGFAALICCVFALRFFKK